MELPNFSPSAREKPGMVDFTKLNDAGVCACVYMHVCVCICIVCMHVCVCVHLYCVHAHVCVCIYSGMYD